MDGTLQPGVISKGGGAQDGRAPSYNCSLTLLPMACMVLL